MVVPLATAVSSLVSEGTVRKIKLQHKKQPSCYCSVDEGTVPPIKNSEICVHLNACIALVHSYVCLGCVCVCVWGGGGGGGYLRPPIAL